MKWNWFGGCLYCIHTLIQQYKVTCAQEMYDEVHKHFANVDIAILSAAVADYKPKYVSDQKIKKKDT